MPATAEKEAKKSSFLKDVRNATIFSVLLVSGIHGHDLRTREGKPTPGITSSSTPDTCPTPESFPPKREPVVIYMQKNQ